MTWIAPLRLPGLPETQGCCNHIEFLDPTLSFEAEDVGYMHFGLILPMCNRNPYSDP